jgi:hypothetical protein
MQLDRGRIAVDDDRIKVKAISEAANDGELVGIRRRISAGGWRAGFGVGVAWNARNRTAFVG